MERKSQKFVLSNSKIAVIGLGNVLRGDDGFGPAVIRNLESHYSFHPIVDLIDMGAPGIDLAPFLHDVDQVVFVDTAKSGYEPGTLTIYSREEILKRTQSKTPKISGHESDIYAAIFKIEWESSSKLDFVMVAAEPQDLSENPGLSPSLIAAIEPATERVIEVLKSKGVRVELSNSETTDPWWKNQLTP